MMKRSPLVANTVLGMVAVVLWSTTVAFGRSLTEQLGSFTAGATIFGLAGLLGLGFQMARGTLKDTLHALTPAFVLRCGGLFVFYELCLYVALGLAANRSQVLEVALVQYLWPMLTLFFSVLILGIRARAFFWPGAVLAMSGVTLAMTQNQGFSWQSFQANLAHNTAPYGVAAAAAVSWALYSVLSRKWSGPAQSGGVVLFMLLTGVVLGLAGFTWREQAHWTGRSILELVFLAVSSNVAYSFWEHAMRKGNVVLVASFSYFTPLFSTLVSSVYLQVGVGARVWLGCALVIAGAMICNLTVRERRKAEPVVDEPSIAAAKGEL